MKHLELTEQKAIDLNKLCQFAADKGVLHTFNIEYYQRQNPQYEIHYLRHLLDVAKQYENVNKLIDLSHTSMCATWNTREFLKSGGFLRILKIEQREDNIQDFTLTTLRQSALGTKEWLRLLGVTIVVAITTSLLTDKLSEPNSPQNTTQNTKPFPFGTSELYQHFLNSHKDSLQRLEMIQLNKR
jgi:hypothetical protein